MKVYVITKFRDSSFSQSEVKVGGGGGGGGAVLPPLPKNEGHKTQPE